MSKISWTEKTWNPVVGCTEISDGCLNCYAEKMAKRLAAMWLKNPAKHHSLKKYRLVTNDNVNPNNNKWNGLVICDESALQIPLKRKKPTMYFVPSMGDLFHKDVPFVFIDKVFAVMALCPQHTFQVLTKRPERMEEYMRRSVGRVAGSETSGYIQIAINSVRLGNYDGWQWPMTNVWLGTSASNQKDLDKNVPYLLQTPAAVRFLSLEPLLEYVQINKIHPLDGQHWTRSVDGHYKGIDWVIVGAESKGAYPGRECKIEWVRNVVQQCKAAGVPVHVKQLHVWKVTEPNKRYYRLYETEKEAQTQFGGCKPKLVLVKDINLFPKDLQIRKMPCQILK